jgi:hypothetical protein
VACAVQAEDNRIAAVGFLRFKSHVIFLKNNQEIPGSRAHEKASHALAGRWWWLVGGNGPLCHPA